MGFIVAVDGPAGSGKGTVTKLVGKRENLIYIDTGAMYRCVTLYMIRNNINIENLEDVNNVLDNIKIELKIEDEIQKVYLNGEDVSLEIRTEKVNKLVSPVSKILSVREKLKVEQRKMSKFQDIIMEGRDIGTVVFPNADVKIYLDATPEERATRRLKQNIENGMTEETYEQILESVKNRDYIDSHREIAPLKQAEDAIYIDSSNLTIEEVVNKIVEIIKQKR
jgi:cytidylate kinase